MKKENGARLWTKDFSCITAATALSIIGGEAINLPISLLVFAETKSTFLSALIWVCGMLPDIIVPIFAAPMVDRGSKKRWIVTLDTLMMLLYVGMGLWTLNHPFNYGLYVGFTIAVALISILYRLAYGAWYPDLIPEGAKQKGFAVSAGLYPFIVIVMSPVSAFLYDRLAIGWIFLMVAALMCFSILIESCITNTKSARREVYTFAQYKADLRGGFEFIKKEKGLRNIYTYMGITNGVSSGMETMTQAFYQTQPWLTVTMLGFLSSAEMLGRTLSSVFAYTKEVPRKKRYAFTKVVYLIYDSLDAVLLFLPYPLMLVSRFVCGALGNMSGTLRQSAVYSYLPQDIRARVNALFDVVFALGGIFFQLLAGALGQVLPYRIVAMLIGLCTLLSCVVLIILPRKENARVYEA